MKGRLIVHAPNVHTGGGAVLLTALLHGVDGDLDVLLIKDERMSFSPVAGARIDVIDIPPRLLSRLLAERRLKQMAAPQDVVIAFGNLPPLFSLRAATVLFLQNRYLVDPAMSTSGFGLGTRVRILVERLWLHARIGNAGRILVQTPTMAELTRVSLGRDAEVAAFCEAANASDPVGGDLGSVAGHDFIYVSSGEPHKNHAVLFDAWALMAREGLRPKLAVTLSPDRSRALVDRIEWLNRERGTDIVNLGTLSKADVERSYRRARALVFPSLYESYGLPLIEASAIGLPIVASERDYVRDLVSPAETFDPMSPRSLARAIGRFLGMPSDIAPPLPAKDFIKRICTPG